ncbi:UDP-glycosyltransferase 73C4-like [Trifolium pratense]|uniref:UDP-glycosyltransferase 73C4-like n=1 Tax=Trifolium pratense TaxID=57577 RepID=UPI001E69269B|nr:UDP-glycosyltransferase 73C4-like [Trifolium pratense]
MEESCNSKSSNSNPLKIYFLPYPSPGHMNPMINLAQIFTTRGHHVTILTTPSNTKLIPNQNKNKLNIHILNFPSNNLNLNGIENLSSARDPQTALKIHIATNLLIPQVQTFLQQNPPDVFVPDIMFSFSNLEIPVIPFDPMPIFVSCIFEAINNNPNVLSQSSLPFVVPGNLPHTITLPVNPSNEFHTLSRPVLNAKHNGKHHGIIVNSFVELEQEYIEYYQKVTGVKVWHIGITSLMMDHFNCCNGIGDDGGDGDGDGDACLSWLNSREANSVVYICFGSLCRLNREQYMEIGRGIEASGKGFLWVVPEDDEEFCVVEESLSFKRGMVVRRWVNQRLILKHHAIGGFLTHCGWNSVAEGICAGVPMITMPRFSDQFLNERLVTEVLRIGVEVGGCEWSLSPFGARNKVVSRKRIEKAVRRVMEDGDSSMIRKRAKEMRDKACKAVQEGGSSYHNLTNLVQSLKQISLDRVLQTN